MHSAIVVNFVKWVFTTIQMLRTSQHEQFPHIEETLHILSRFIYSCTTFGKVNV